MSIESGFTLPSLTSDGRAKITIIPSKIGWRQWFSGEDDDLVTPAIGGGTKMSHKFTGVETWEQDFQFKDPVELQDGHAKWSGTWDIEDTISVRGVLPATVVTPNAGAGNVDLIDTQQGYNLIVPNGTNTGSHDTTLANAVPVPAGGAGFWDVDSETGVITPSASPGQASWYLLDLQIINQFMQAMPMGASGNSLASMDIDTYSVEWFHPNWKLRVTVDKASAGAGEFGMWVLLFRSSTT